MTRSVRRNRRMLQVTGVSTAALLALSACSSSDSNSAKSDTSASASSSPKLSGTVTVFAAASLKESFTALGKEFEKAHPGTKVTFSFGGSDTLAAQITGGAPADVFAAASPDAPQQLYKAGLVSKPVTSVYVSTRTPFFLQPCA